MYSILRRYLSSSPDLPSHVTRLREVFQRLSDHGLKLKPSKVQICRDSCTFLGYVIGKNGISTDPSKVEAVRAWKEPGCLKDLRAYLGLCSYYRRFIPGFSEIASCLHALTGKRVPFAWTEEHRQAFERLKVALITAPVVALPQEDGKFILECDASLVAAGAVLSQVQGPNNEEKVICYFSRMFNSAQSSYCTTRRELLSILMAVQHFKHYLVGRKFTIRTDHSYLRWLHSTPEVSGQKARWIMTLSEYDFDIQHRPGAKHGNADALSRQACKQCGLRAEDFDKPVEERSTNEGPVEEGSRDY